MIVWTVNLTKTHQGFVKMSLKQQMLVTFIHNQIWHSVEKNLHVEFDYFDAAHFIAFLQ